MSKNNSNPFEFDFLAETETHTIDTAAHKKNLIQILNTTFTFESVITKANQPIGKGVTVYIYHKGLGTLVAKTETDENSKIYVPNLSKHNEYLIVATDPKDIYNSVVFDITFDLSQSLTDDYFIKYYNIYETSKILRSYSYWNILADRRTDPSLLFFISIPNIKEDKDLIWGTVGTIRTTTIDEARCFSFSNNGEYHFLYHNPVPPKSPFTFSAYIYIDSTARNTATNNNIFKQHTQSFFIDSNLKLNYKNTDTNNPIDLISNTTINLNQWNHVCVTFDGLNIYLFLNGVLQQTVSNTNGMSYANSYFTLGEGLKGFLTQPAMYSECKFTSDFSILLQPFSYDPNVYSDPTDTLAEYVRLKVKSDRLTYGLRDEVNNISFNSGIENTGFTPVTNEKSRMIAYSKNSWLSLGNKSFCLEFKVKIKSLFNTYPKLLLNHNESWTTNSWEFSVNHPNYPNTYSLHVYNVSSWAFNYPLIYNELTDIAIVRDGSTLRFYINGFLDRSISIGTTSFDNSSNGFLAMLYYIVVNFYDLKVTVGHARYTSNYIPAQLAWADTNLALEQYKIVNFPFKQNLYDNQYVFSFTTSNVVLSKLVSVNNTRSAYFKNAKITSNSKLMINNEKFTIELFYQPKTESLTGIASILSVSSAFRLGTNSGVLSFYNGTSWEDSTLTLTDTQLHHIVLQRNGTTIKLLANGNLVLTTTYTMPAGLKTITIGCFNDTQFIDGYINNFIIYKNINKYADTYSVPLEDPVLLPPEDLGPQVSVTPYTTAALDFENGLVDQISTTVWTKEGTADITSVNKIFGENSFETKAIGDSLYTNSNIITGGSTPFTIEFYNVLNPNFSTTTAGTDLSLYAQPDSQGYYQGVFIAKETRNIGYYRNGTMPNLVYTTLSSYKINVNDVNKYTITYDGAAIRVFVNDKLVNIIGSGSGHIITNQPFQFLSYNFNTSKNTTSGIIDNINIHDGIATKVRDYDPYEENLIVDLAFDGENNSTKIVDNGSGGCVWTCSGNAKISTTKPFDGFSSLQLDGNFDRISTPPNTNLIISNGIDFTIRFKFIVNDTTKINYLLSKRASNSETLSDTARGGYAISITDKVAFYGWYGTSTDNIAVEIISNAGSIQPNIEYIVDIVRKNMTCYLYINGILQTSLLQSNEFTDANYITYIGQDKVDANQPTRDFNGYIKNFKLYKGVAIFPENPTGKIQLDFDNNVVDKYGNSTWTASNLTFDSVNSVKGSAAKFASNTTISCKNSNLDFGSGNFSLTYDIKPSESGVGGRYCLTPDLVYTDTKAMWFFGDSLGFDYRDKPANTSGLAISSVVNQFYNFNLIRNNKNLFTYVNDVLIATHNLTSQTFDLSTYGSGAFLGKSTNFGVGQSFLGSLDNFKTIKNTTEIATVNKPSVHFPLETNAINIGFAALTVNSPGSPIYTSLNNVKCIKFEAGKYLAINANNIFNLGTSSDFYIEFDFYPMLATTNQDVQGIFSNASTWSSDFETNRKLLIYFNQSTKKIVLELGARGAYSIDADLNTWNRVSLKRKNNILYLNNLEILNTLDLNLSTDYLIIGKIGWDNSFISNHYVSNFKMFVGTSEIPESYNDKAVLDLDFKPTGKSYLFKDNNNNVILHPSNITQRNYLNSKYCCTFNGTNQCILTGKNPLFSFGTDDFIMEFKFKPISTTNWNILISNGNTTSGDAAYCYIGMSPNNGGNPNQMYATINSSALQIIHPQQIDTNSINTVVFYKEGNTYTLVVNGQAVSNTVTTIPNFDLNNNNNTIIGRTNHNSGSNNHWFTGEMYSVKIFRNTSDLTLLD